MKYARLFTKIVSHFIHDYLRYLTFQRPVISKYLSKDVTVELAGSAMYKELPCANMLLIPVVILGTLYYLIFPFSG